MTRKTMLKIRSAKSTRAAMLLAGILAGGILVSPVAAQTAGPSQSVAPAAKPAAASTPYRNQPDRLPSRANAYYESVWGIESPTVKAVESGIMIRFSYRVVDPEKAKPLNDKTLNPYLESPEKGLRLVVPTMEKVGQLRQAPHEIEAGKSYWMAFSNNGRMVKPGDRVDVVIGHFHARALLVE